MRGSERIRNCPPNPLSLAVIKAISARSPERLNHKFKGDVLCLFLAPPPPGVPGEGPDCQFPAEIEGCWADSAPDPGGKLFLIFVVVLSAVGFEVCLPPASKKDTASTPEPTYRPAALSEVISRL